MKKIRFKISFVILLITFVFPASLQQNVTAFAQTGEVIISDDTDFVIAEAAEAEPTVIFSEEAEPAVTLLPIVILGGNLNASQKSTVLSFMGITEADLVSGQYQVMYVDNATEHFYLDSYIDPSVIGKNSLSSVLIRPTAEGSGIVVSSKNINYCTTGMYRNALLTAGVENADVFVVAPTPISGTAALIGAIKGYSQVSGAAINDKTIDAALDELVTTGEISGANGVETEYAQDVEELIAYLKAKIASGALTSEADIRAAIDEGEKKYGLSLTDKEKDQIVTVLMKIKELGLDPSKLLDQAKDLYLKFGDDLLKNPLNYVDQLTKEAGKGIFADIGRGIVTFFTGVFQKISDFFFGLFH